VCTAGRSRGPCAPGLHATGPDWNAGDGRAAEAWPSLAKPARSHHTRSVPRSWLPVVALSVLLFACNRQPDPPTAPLPPPSAASSASPVAAEASGENAAAPGVPAAKLGSAAPERLSRPAEPLNVILLVVDAMRADMPWAGYPRPIAPNLTELERRSVSYTRAYSVSSYTAKSVAAILSGQYPSSLVRSGVFFTRYPESDWFFPELLKERHVYTMAAHAHMYMRPGASGLDQGFDAWNVVSGITFNNKTDTYVTSDRLTALAIRELEARPTDRRFFMYVHYMDPHDVYMKHAEAPDWGREPRDRYDQEIFFADLWLGRLLDYCRKKPWWRHTAVIVTADHGEAFGEHGRYRHAFELWEPLVRVPMFLHVPGAAPRRIDTPRGHIDLAPTVLDLAGVDPPADKLPGKSLVPELFGASPETRPVLLDLPADSNNFQRRGLVLGEYKVLATEKDYRIAVYDVTDDPGEKRDLKLTDRKRYDEMVARYREAWKAVPKVKPYGGNQLKGGGRATGPSK